MKLPFCCLVEHLDSLRFGHANRLISWGGLWLISLAALAARGAVWHGPRLWKFSSHGLNIDSYPPFGERARWQNASSGVPFLFVFIRKLFHKVTYLVGLAEGTDCLWMVCLLLKAPIKKTNGTLVQWENKNIFINTKIYIFNSNVKWVLMYGCETWKRTAQMTD